ncbi:alpha-L-arabinofuranosidase B, arabinose-binding domain-containing protein, partial [Tanacetum coccineum]
KILREGGEFSWMMMYKKIKNSGVGGGGGEFLREVSLTDVRLDADTIYGRAQQTNLEYLLMLDVDRLVYSFRETAGLPNFEVPYGGWEAPDQELRGHFVVRFRVWICDVNRHIDNKMEK